MFPDGKENGLSSKFTIGLPVNGIQVIGNLLLVCSVIAEIPGEFPPDLEGVHLVVLAPRRIVVCRAKLIDNCLPTSELSGRGVIYLRLDANEVVNWVGAV